MQPTGADLVSGEGVRLTLTTATVMSRALAAAVDLLLEAVVLLFALVATFVAFGSTDSDGLGAAVTVELVLVLAGYPIVMEWLTHGRTVGKLVVGLRAVRDDGGPIGFRQALVRGLAGLVLEKPGLIVFPGLIGALTIFFSKREKRVGDMMAGTIVLDERSLPQRLAAPPPWVPPWLQPWALSLDLHGLDDDLALRVRQFVTRAWDMDVAARDDLAARLRALVEQVTAPPPPRGVPTSDVLMTVLAERRRRSAATYPPANTYPWT